MPRIGAIPWSKCLVPFLSPSLTRTHSTAHSRFCVSYIVFDGVMPFVTGSNIRSSVFIYNGMPCFSGRDENSSPGLLWNITI